MTGKPMTTMRMSRALRSRIEAAAAEAGRSQSQEIEIRLERTFIAGDMAREVIEALRPQAATPTPPKQTSVSPASVTAGISFHEVIDRLAAAYQIMPPQRNSFVYRVQDLQKRGIPRFANPGRGNRVAYSRDQVWELAIAIELARIGLPPVSIVEIIADEWPDMLAAVAANRPYKVLNATGFRGLMHPRGGYAGGVVLDIPCLATHLFPAGAQP